jgi:hypothetical protein
MPHAWSRIVRALFVVYVAATAIHIGWILAHEPFIFDAWNVAVDTHARPFTVGRFFDYWWYEYTHSNPRLGQLFAYLGYKLEYFAVIAAPIAYLALSAAIVVLGTGRLPSWRRGRDLALWSIAIGFIWFALPSVGRTLFDRAYGANYFYTAAIQLWFLVPLRLRPEACATWSACIAYAVFGVLAGMCNEHTGPTLCTFMVGYAWWVHGKTQQRPTLAWSGAVGALVGFAAIFFAPGQDERYEGLAQRMGLVGRVVNRGVVGNLEILRDLLLAAAPLLAVLVILLIVAKDDGNERRAALRRALNLLALVVAAAVVMAVTIFASPKLGPRFFYVSMSLLLAAVIAVVDAVATRRVVALLVVVAALASAYAAARSVPLYRRVARAGEARLAALAAAPPGSVFVADAFEQVDESWWFLGDDFRDAKKRELVAKYFGLAGVVFESYDPNAPLGLTSVRLVPHYDVDPPGCLDEYGGLTLGSSKGFDLAGLHREAQIAIALLRSRLVGAELRSLDLEVTLSDAKLAAPRPRVLLARWTPARFEGYVGRIERSGRSTQRSIRLPAGIAGSDAEMYVLQVGGEARRLGTARDDKLQYAPWKSGVYWVLACRSDVCFVIAATRHGA